MANISSLPEELLSKIFGYIDSNVQLAQCRLVCSRWSHSANAAMFNNTIVFTTKEKAMALFGQLFNDPTKGELIRHIYFKKGFDTFWLVKTIFDVAPLPNVKSFDGESLAASFYTTLLDIIKNSPTTFSKLRALPEYKDEVNQTYCDVLRACRHTISDISVYNKNIYINDTMKAFALELDTFDKLKSLKYWSSFQRTSDVELLLKGCIHLTKLTLGALMDGDAVEKQELEIWMRAEVKQVESLTQLSIKSQCRCDVMEYLVYKYPNIQKISIFNSYYERIFAEDITKFKSNMNRVLQAIKGIPDKSMSFWLLKNENLFQIIEFFTQKGYRFNVSKTQDDVCLYVEIQGL